MIGTETEAINWIYSFSSSKSERCLAHMHEILAKLDNPHQKLKTVHIAGTNGKGSTVAYICEGFMQAGYKVATFTSPYMICFGERMSINNIPMPEADLVKYANLLKSSLPCSTCAYTPFDIITLISFLYFVGAAVDIAIYETGIGGRLDSTNVIAPLAAAITNVGHDHAEILGETQLERAIEKLGIIKEKVPLFTTVEDPDLLAEFEKVCKEKNATFYQVLEDAELISNDSDGIVFNCRGDRYVCFNMYGEHQFKNAALAVGILGYLGLFCGFTEVSCQLQISNTTWQGRFEQLQEEPPIVLDGAHNLEGIQALIHTLKKVYSKYKKKFLFSAIGTKDVEQMIRLLSEVAEAITFTKGTHLQSVAPEVLLKYDGGYFGPMYEENPQRIFEDYKEAVELELKKLKTDEILVICGSLYFISDVRKYLLERRRFSN